MHSEQATAEAGTAVVTAESVEMAMTAVVETAEEEAVGVSQAGLTEVRVGR